MPSLALPGLSSEDPTNPWAEDVLRLCEKQGQEVAGAPDRPLDDALRRLTAGTLHAPVPLSH